MSGERGSDTSTASKEAARKKVKNGWVRGFNSFADGFSKMQWNYGRVIYVSCKQGSFSKWEYVTQRVSTSQASEEGKAKAHAEYKAAPDRSYEAISKKAEAWHEYLARERVAINRLKKLVYGLEGRAEVLWRGSNDVADAMRQSETDWRRCRDLAQHNLDGYYTPIFQEISAAARKAKRPTEPVSEELYVRFKADIVARATAETEYICQVMDEIRNRMAAILQTGLYTIVELNEGETSAVVKWTEVAANNLIGAADLTAIVCPVETVGKSFESANALGEIVKNGIFGAIKRSAANRKAKELMADTSEHGMKRKLDIINKLKDNPVKLAEYMVRNQRNELENALAVAHLPVAGMLMGVAASVEWSGVAVAVTKSVFPFIWPVVKSSIFLVFDSMSQSNIAKAEKAWLEQAKTLENERIESLDQLSEVVRKFDVGSFEAFCDEIRGKHDKIVDEAMSKIGGKDSDELKKKIQEGIAEAKLEIQAGVGELAEKRAEEKKKTKIEEWKESALQGIKAITPEGIAGTIQERFISPTVAEALKFIPAEPSNPFTAEMLLSIQGDFRLLSDFEIAAKPAA
jgi:hypothetical protein